MKNSINNQLCAPFKLIAILFFVATSFFTSAQTILIDNCATGPFMQIGNGSQNDIPAAGAIGGSRDISISNTSTYAPWMDQISNFSVLRINPRSTYLDQFAGNYDIGWGDNEVLGGNELNLNAANYSQIQITFYQVPWTVTQMIVSFNKPGDPDYSSFTMPTQGGYNRTTTLPFSSFAGLNPADIDGIRLGFFNCNPDSQI